MTSLWNKLNASGAIIQNLGSCDVRSEGMCCYFPSFCDPIAKCISTPPSSLIDLPSTFPRCACPDGYQGDGRVKGTGCHNINECEMGIAKCSQGCIDLIPGYRCECYSGFRLENDGRTCRDIDECIENSHDCSHLCINTHGGYKCDCPPGYNLSPEDHKTCIDIDECQVAHREGRPICPYHDLCINTMGGYECGCPPGLSPRYEQDSPIPICEDVDECFNNAEACPNAREPTQNRLTQICENVHAGHICKCLPGLKPVFLKRGTSGLKRRLLDESTESSNDSTARTRFYSSQLSTSLIPLPDFTTSSESSSSSYLEYKFHSNVTTVTDMDLLESENDISSGYSNLIIAEDSSDISKGGKRHPLSVYDDLIAQGSFQFGKRGEEEAKSGRQLAEVAQNLIIAREPMTPDEINLMRQRTKDVTTESSAHSRSLNLDQLKDRYKWTAEQRDSLYCVDVDECKTAKGRDACGADADCVNVFRSFECRCRDSKLEFDSTTKQCVQSEELPRNRICPPSYCSSPCVLTANGYYCGCPKGYVATSPEKWEATTRRHMDAKTEREFQEKVSEDIHCVDFDECATNAHVCGVGCKCKNTKGSFQCVCDPGKTMHTVSTDEDYDFLLSISNQFQQAIKSFESQNDVIRMMNHNDPRHTVVALASLKKPLPTNANYLRLDIDRWLIDQIEWSKTEYISLPADYEERLSELIASDDLLRDFIKATAHALRDSKVNVCAKSDPCAYADCPAQRPCCASDGSSVYNCIPSQKGPGLFGRVTYKCPPGSVNVK